MKVGKFGAQMMKGVADLISAPGNLVLPGWIPTSALRRESRSPTRRGNSRVGICLFLAELLNRDISN